MQFSQIPEDIEKGGHSWQDIIKEWLWEDTDKIGDFSSTDFYKTDTMLEGRKLQDLHLVVPQTYKGKR
jgi:hypothetical protein